jgi:hypothetical protein
MMKTKQPTRKMILPIRYRMSPLTMPEAIKKPAHTRKRSQPQRWNLLPRIILLDIAITSYLLIMKRTGHRLNLQPKVLGYSNPDRPRRDACKVYQLRQPQATKA